MTDNFIKRPELIEESYQVNDLLDFKSIIHDFKERINKIKKNSIVGLIGPYGSGKSTMLYQIYEDKINIDDNNNSKVSKNKNAKSNTIPPKEKWFIFDAWQYPERKDLWEGFVLDIARQCDEKLFKNTENKIDGNIGKNNEALANATIDIASIAVPLVGLLKNLTPILEASPIKRVYDFQYLLLSILSRIDTTDKKIFIVIEDIDRSGDMGIFFLETLKHFIKNFEEKLSNKVVVIVPIGEEILEKGGDKKARDSYLKILDFNIAFHKEDINFTYFITQVFDKDKLCSSNSNNSDPNIIISHLRYLFENMILKEQQTTIRDIKSILRKSESNFFKLQKKHQKEIDIRILILFTTMEYLYQKEKNDKYNFYLKHSGRILIIDTARKDFWGVGLLFCIIIRKDPIKLKVDKTIIDHPYRIHIIKKDKILSISSPIKSNKTYSINSIYFSVTGVKIIKP